MGVKHSGDKMTTIEKLEKILVSPRLREANKPFVESLLAQASKRDLSEKQIVYVDKFWGECYPPQEVVDAEQEWLSSFTDEMREAVSIMAGYYAYHYPNSRMAKNGKDPNWIPSKEVYEKSCESQWAKTTIKNFKQSFRFNVGDTIVFRNTQHNRSRYNKDIVESPLLVLDQLKDVKNNYVSYYKVIPLTHMEQQITYDIKEDHLNVIKNKKVE